MFRKLALVLCVGVFSPVPSVMAVDESRLWMPSNYERQYLDLKKAAEVAEELDRCVKVIRGTIDLNQSTKDKPIYRIQCRQENGRTYNEMVDGLSFDTLTTPKVVEKVLTADEIEAQRLEEERKRLEEIENTKQVFLQQCLTELESKSKLFINKRLLNDSPEPEEFSLEQAKYYLDFDAEDIHGVALKYRAICWVEPEKTDLRIRTRRE